MQADPHAVPTADSTRPEAPYRAAVRTDARQAGFTLLEILIVVTIIGLLMGFLANNFIGRADDAKKTLAQGQVQKLSQALEIYKLDNGRYPTSEQGLDALVREPSIEPAPRRYQPGGYTDRSQLQDPWGGTLQYEAPGRVNRSSFDICSYGPDGQPSSGGAETDDICNYEQDRR